MYSNRDPLYKIIHIEMSMVYSVLRVNDVIPMFLSDFLYTFLL